MQEVEVKLKCDDPVVLDNLRDKLPSSPWMVEDHEDIYFNSPEGTCLRVGSGRAENGDKRVTFKSHSKIVDGVKTRRELEFDVNSEGFDALKEVFVGLGFPETITVKKTRASYLHESATVCIDNVDGLGYFVEIEAYKNDPAAVATLNLCIEELGLSDLPRVKEGYATLVANL